MKIDLPNLNLPGLTTNNRFKFYELYPRGQVALETKAQLSFLYELNNNEGSRLNNHSIALPKNIFKKTRFSISNKAQLNYSKFLKLRNAYYSAMDPWDYPGSSRDTFFGLNAFRASELINNTWVYSTVFYINTFNNPALDMSFKKLPLDQDYPWMTVPSNSAPIPGVSNKYNETMSLNSLLAKIKTDGTAQVDILGLVEPIIVTKIGLVEPIIVTKTFIIEGSKFTVITSLQVDRAYWERLVGDIELITPAVLEEFNTYWLSLEQKSTEYLDSMPCIDLANGLINFTRYLSPGVDWLTWFRRWGTVQQDTPRTPTTSYYAVYDCKVKAKIYVHIED